jgi:hypothetical protein
MPGVATTRIVIEDRHLDQGGFTVAQMGCGAILRLDRAQWETGKGL